MTQISGEEDGFVVRFAAVPARDIALTNISDASWSLAWPLAAVSALGSVQIVPRKAKFYRGKRYDARFLSNVSDADVLRQYLKALGFETTKGPFLLRRGIHHPALRGRELTDWMFQGTWKNPNTYMAEGGHGPIAFEEVGEAL